MRSPRKNMALIRAALNDHDLDYEELRVLARIVECLGNIHTCRRVRILLLKFGEELGEEMEQ